MPPADSTANFRTVRSRRSRPAQFNYSVAHSVRKTPTLCHITTMQSLFQSCLDKETELLDGRAFNTKTISFHALRRAQTTIEDFVLSYFHWHGLQLRDFFRLMPVLVFVEATIYQMDEDNEDIAQTAQALPDYQFPAFVTIERVLRAEKLWDDRIAAELASGNLYWQLERGICSRWAAGQMVTEEEVLACSMRKSFDYRVLNLLLYKLTGRPYDDAELEFLRVDEHLVDINDDLVDYEKDLHRNSFNIYRGFVLCHGADQAQLGLIQRISQFEAELETKLQLLDPERRACYCKRRTDAMEEPGSEKWVFPMAIENENAFRVENGGKAVTVDGNEKKQIEGSLSSTSSAEESE